MDCSLLSSSVHGILPARILEWVAIALSRGSSWYRYWTQVSCTAGRLLTIWVTRETKIHAINIMYVMKPSCLHFSLTKSNVRVRESIWYLVIWERISPLLTWRRMCVCVCIHPKYCQVFLSCGHEWDHITLMLKSWQFQLFVLMQTLWSLARPVASAILGSSQAVPFRPGCCSLFYLCCSALILVLQP